MRLVLVVAAVCLAFSAKVLAEESQTETAVAACLQEFKAAESDDKVGALSQAWNLLKPKERFGVLRHMNKYHKGNKNNLSVLKYFANYQDDTNGVDEPNCLTKLVHGLRAKPQKRVGVVSRFYTNGLTHKEQNGIVEELLQLADAAVNGDPDIDSPEAVEDYEAATNGVEEAEGEAEAEASNGDDDDDSDDSDASEDGDEAEAESEAEAEAEADDDE